MSASRHPRDVKRRKDIGPPLTAEERETRLSKTLCYILRHGAAKEGLKIYKGGYMSEEEIALLPQMKRYTAEEIEHVIATSTSSRTEGLKRFETLYVNGRRYIRASYAVSIKDVEEHDFPSIFAAKPKDIADESAVLPLAKLCLHCITNNIKMYSEFEGIGDGYILECIMSELRTKKLLNNTNLKLFLIEDLDSLELGTEIYVSDATLRRIGQKCINLRRLKLVGCVALTDTTLQFICKKCTQLRQLHFEACKYLSDLGLKHIQKFCKNIRSLVIEGAPLITNEGIQHFVANCTTLQSLVIIKCEQTSLSGLNDLQKNNPHLQEFTFVAGSITTDSDDTASTVTSTVPYNPVGDDMDWSYRVH